jgi:hypothetical protein
MFEVFTIMRQLHSWLRYLSEALSLQPARPLSVEMRTKLKELEGLTRESPSKLSWPWTWRLTNAR